MRLQHIFEYRRNPELNTVEQGHQGALDFIKNNIDYNSEYNCGVTMTSVHKVGLNPQSSYETPVGVYFYPVNYYVYTKERHFALEYQDDAKFIQIFRINGNVLLLKEMTDSETMSYVQDLIGLVPTLSKTYNVSGDKLRVFIQTTYKDSKEYALVQSPGGYFWYVLFELSKFLAIPDAIPRKKTKNTDDDEDDPFAVTKIKNGRVTASRNTIIWNKLFRMLGINAVVDNGAGIVHQNEPTQGVVFDTSSIHVIKTFENSATDKTTTAQNDIFAIRTPTSAWINRALAYISNHPNDNKAKKISNYAAYVLLKDPEMLSKMTMAQVKSIGTSTGNTSTLRSLELNFNLVSWRDDGASILAKAKNGKPLREFEIDTLNTYRTIFSQYAGNANAKGIVDEINSLNK